MGNDQAVEIADHPLTPSENIATVEEVSGRLREEAFQGTPQVSMLTIWPYLTVIIQEMRAGYLREDL